MGKEKLRKTKLILLKDVATRKADAGMDEKAGRRKAQGWLKGRKTRTIDKHQV